jgi:hypothetical protein
VRYLCDEGNFSKAEQPEIFCPGRVVDILEDCGSFDPGSSPGRGVPLFKSNSFTNSNIFLNYDRRVIINRIKIKIKIKFSDYLNELHLLSFYLI